MAPIFSLLALASVAAMGVQAHPGHNVAEEAAERAEFFKFKPRSVGSCATQLRRRGHTSNMMNRRRELAKAVQAKRGLAGKPLLRRDFADYNISHASTSDVAYGDDETLMFADDSSCVLQPEVTEGPYYVDGELIRSDVSEDQAGVPLFLDVQFVDTATCEPVPAVFIDFWHCNATGVYSGVSASGNGDSDDDDSNLDATFLRGVQQTDANGVVQFETIFPGHYTGRATHIHVMSHSAANTTIRNNATILGLDSTTHASHVGQIFFDQDLISLVEVEDAYAANEQELTLNADDDILGEEAADMDPFVEYVLLGDSVSDGILSWITIGIDSTADSEISSAATHYASGGVANANSGMGGGPGGDNSTDGAAPSGTPPAK